MEAKAYCSVLILHVVAFLHYTGYPVETTPLYQLGPVSVIKCIYSVHMHMFVIKEPHVLNLNIVTFICTTLHIILIYNSSVFLPFPPFPHFLSLSLSLSPFIFLLQLLLKEVSSHLKDPVWSEADPSYYQSIVRMYLKHLSSLVTDALVSLYNYGEYLYQ